MKSLLTFALTGAALATSLSAHAVLLDATFSGTVQSQTDTTTAVGSAISGNFVFDTSNSSFVSFVIGTQSVAAGFASTAAMTPDAYTALYTAQVTPVGAVQGAVNSSFTLDLEGLAPWPAATAVALLGSGSSALMANLDTALSTFGYYQANADGTGIHALTASLNNVAVVPEPANLLLFAAGAALLGLRRQNPHQR